MNISAFKKRLANAIREVDIAFSEGSRDLKTTLKEITKEIKKETGFSGEVKVFKAHYYSNSADTFEKASEVFGETELVGEISFDSDEPHADNFLYVLISANDIKYNHYVGGDDIYGKTIKNLDEIKTLYLKAWRKEFKK